MSADVVRPGGRSQSDATPQFDIPEFGQHELGAVTVDETDQDTTHSRNAPFACNVCKRSYSRVDHLARHHRSHTREKPFPCEICGKTFARADLVKRHATCHSEGASRKRKRRSSLSSRTSVACTACASAKLKCGNEKPCLRCVKKGLDCIPVSDGSNARDVIGTRAGTIDTVAAQRTEEDTRMDSGRLLVTQSQRESQDFASQANMVRPLSPLQLPRPDVYSEIDGFQTNVQTDAQDHAIDNFQPDDYQTGLSTVNMNLDENFIPDGNSLGDFLANIMMPFSPAELGLGPLGTGGSDSLMRDVFDFGIDDNYDMNDVDFHLLHHYTVPGSPTQQQGVVDENYCPPSRGEDNNGSQVDPVSVEAFQRSLWRWTPGKTDQAHCEQLNLVLPPSIGAQNIHSRRQCEETLKQFARDKMLAMVLSNCEQEAIPRIVTSFPSTEMLDHLMQEYFFYHDQDGDSIIHIPTFDPQAMRPELVASTVFFGAVRSLVPVVRKLGFALQEYVRLALPKAFEKDNSMTRDLQLLQAYVLELKLGLWSGNRRKMEIAESHGLPLITMLRRAGRFKRLRKQPAAPSPEDTPDVLDTKWRAWVEAESFKRLVYFIAVYDAHLSMSFQVPPLITYGELTLDLPASQTLWKAKTASSWREAYLSCNLTDDRGASAVIACVHTAHDMLEAQERIDLGFSINIALSMFWKVIWDARQLQSATRPYAGRSVTASLTSGHWQHELSQTLRNFCIVVGEAETLAPTANLLHDYLLLNVYVSFEELSLFAGKEGHREARRVFASLKQWADSRDSRQALCHAGQVLREAVTFAPGTLFGFYAVALYHAGLTLWAYGLLTNGAQQMQKQSMASGASVNQRELPNNTNTVIYVDGDETGETQKFVSLNRATPAIKRRYFNPNGRDREETVFLDDPKAVMTTVIDALRDNYLRRFMPTLVENLINLMEDLGKVANTKIAKKS